MFPRVVTERVVEVEVLGDVIFKPSDILILNHSFSVTEQSWQNRTISFSVKSSYTIA